MSGHQRYKIRPQARQTIMRMKIKVFNGLRIISNEEIEEYENEDSARGVDRSGGVGLVRIAETEDMFWAAVRCWELPERVCPECNVVMSLQRSL